MPLSLDRAFMCWSLPGERLICIQFIKAKRLCRMEDCRGGFAAAALIFLAGVAGARGVARSLGRGLCVRLGLSCNRGYVLAVVFEGGGHFIYFIEFVLAETGGDLMIDAVSDLGDVADAEVGEVGAS